MSQIRTIADLKLAMAEKQRQTDLALEKKQPKELPDDCPEMWYPRPPSQLGWPNMTDLFLPEQLEIMDNAPFLSHPERQLSPEEKKKLQAYLAEDKLRQNRLNPIIAVKLLLRGIVNINFDSVTDVISILREILAEHEKEIKTEVPPEL